MSAVSYPVGLANITVEEMSGLAVKASLKPDLSSLGPIDYRACLKARILRQAVRPGHPPVHTQLKLAGGTKKEACRRPGRRRGNKHRS